MSWKKILEKNIQNLTKSIKYPILSVEEKKRKQKELLEDFGCNSLGFSLCPSSDTRIKTFLAYDGDISLCPNPPGPCM